MLALRPISIDSCGCGFHGRDRAISITQEIDEALRQARLELFYTYIYPDLAAAKMMDWKDLEAVPVLLSSNDKFAEQLWKRITRLHRYINGTKQ